MAQQHGATTDAQIARTDPAIGTAADCLG